ncbi:MAG: hypothetical protein VR77_10075 [Flavobacteriales bacterium BRH_c54]|nr:MAG: hypothetical protein VR77_10075 [Flavobacteriales bacterium BRH_c54]
MKLPKLITQTKPFTPNIEDYFDKIRYMFDVSWFTNHGKFVTEFEQKMAEYFDSKYFVLVTNGTIAIQLAIRALGLKGEIITTPFSYVATTSSIVWENCIPIFADISLTNLNIDCSKIETLITDKTSAILATNVFGYPCDFSALKKIAEQYNLKLIFDNAHGFGSKKNGQSLMNFGDVSTISFHATKLFHSIEGGGISCNSKDTYEKLLLLRNFGHTSPISFDGLGINAKMNEVCASMGLCNYPYIDKILITRKNQWQYYFNHIINKKITKLIYKNIDIEYNHAYFPIILDSEITTLKLYDFLLNNNIQTRRYFYPSLNKLNYVDYISCKNSENISSRILCLPLYFDLTEEEQSIICELINNFKIW